MIERSHVPFFVPYETFIKNDELTPGNDIL